MDVLDGKTPEDEPLLHETDEGRLLLTIIQDYDRQEEFVRLSQIRKWRKHMHYWNGFQYLAWNEMAQDWMTPEDIVEEDPQADLDPALYAKVVNTYKAHGEILIGALAAGTPIVRFFPKDADDQEDVVAAKARSKIGELISKHNHAHLLMMKALFIMYNQGLVACYNENKSDDRFGTVEVPEYADTSVTYRQHLCPSCGAELNAEQFDTPGPADPVPQPMPPQVCPECQNIVEPMPNDEQGMEPRQIGITKEPKNRECLELYGPLNVKVPNWCREQVATPYVILETDENVSMMREIYPELAHLIQGGDFPDSYEREARVPTQYKSDFPRDLCTVQRVWLRPWALNIYQNKMDEIEPIKQKYKDGVYVVVINKSLVAEILQDKLDDHWTLSEHPLSDTLHVEPLGAAAIPMSDIGNELMNLTLETVEFGLPETWADSHVVDFDAYPRQEARPGMINQATAPAGRSLGEGFFTTKAATLSREVEPFADRVHNMTQFVMGSYPSIYGGPQDGGSGTAKEYEMSKASALQRLSTTWTILQEWWCRVQAKAVESYVKSMKGDESFVKQQGGNFLNVWIRKADLSGDIGSVEPEISETFPVSWTQKRDIMLNLIQMQNEDIAAVIRHPENAGLVASIIGVPELYIPGDDDRGKQLNEIALLIQGEPQEMPPNPMNPQGLLVSTVPIDATLDNHYNEAETCRAWLKSEIGQDAKINNPAGYANVLAHLKEHDQIQQQMAAMQKEAESDSEDGKDEMSEVGA